MKDLNLLELTNINGGKDLPPCHPPASTDPEVEAGYGVGWHIGHAIGDTIDQIDAIMDKIGDWFNPFD